MTRNEVAVRYQIPEEILDEYETCKLFGTGKQAIAERQYEESDIETVSMIMTLHDIGFTKKESEIYMELYLSEADTIKQQLQMLEKKRSASLDEIHIKEAQLNSLDYLRHKIKMNQNKKEGDL